MSRPRADAVTTDNVTARLSPSSSSSPRRPFRCWGGASIGHPKTAVVVLLLGWLLAGCASPRVAHDSSGAGGSIASGFPSREEVTESASREAPPAQPASPIVAAPWAVDTDRADRPETVTHTPWTDLVAQELAPRPGVRVSAGLQCAAREASRFFLTNRASPDTRVLRFIIGRCGETIAMPSAAYWSGDAPAAASDDELLANWGPEIRAVLRDIGPKQNGGFGAWLEREGGKVALAVVYGSRLALLNVTGPGPETPTVIVRGSLQIADSVVLGLINQGPHGVAVCAESANLPRPGFELACPLAAGDRAVWIDVLAGQPERALMHVAGSVFVRVPGEAAATYAPSISAGDEMRDEATFRREVLARVNALRTAAGLPSVTLAEAQSQTNTRLAPHFLRAEESGDEMQQDRLALGMLAGWDVEGTILAGGLYAMWLGSVHGPGDWVAGVLEFPAARYTLLNPTSRALALGPQFDRGIVGAVVTTYALHDDQDLTRSVSEVVDHLRAARTRSGVNGPVLVQSLPGLPGVMSELRGGRREPDRVLHRLLEQVTTDQQRGATAFLVHTQRLEAIQWPTELLASGPLELAVGVTVVRPPDAPWGHYAVLLVLLQGAGRVI